MRVMICLVGEQPMPNIIAALHQDQRPHRVEFLVSLKKSPDSGWLVRNEEFEKIAKNTASLLQGFGITQFGFHDVKPYDIDHVRTQCLKTVEACRKQDPEAEVIFNITGGTKLMSLGAYQAAQELSLPILYVETDRRETHHILPPSTPEIIRVRDLQVSHYLAAHGVSPGGKDRTQEAEALPQGLKDAAGYLATTPTAYRVLDALRAPLQATARKAGGQTLAITVPSDRVPPDGQTIIAELQARGVLSELQARPDGLAFIISANNAKFLEGDWLEFFIYHKVRQHKPELFTDCRMSLEIKWSGRAKRIIPTNEIDVAVTTGITFTICSCKTGKLEERDRDGQRVDDKNEPIYQLETIAQAIGLDCGKVLAVARAEKNRGGDITLEFTERALLLGIAPVYAHDLRFIDEIMMQPHYWVERLRKLV